MVRKIFSEWWPTMIVVAVILYATLNSDPVGTDKLPPIPNIDKLIHAIMFGGLFSAIIFDRARSGRSNPMRTKLVIAALCLVSGALDEVFQNILENGRQGDIYDFLADFTGILIAFFTAPPAIRAVLRKNQSKN